MVRFSRYARCVCAVDAMLERTSTPPPVRILHVIQLIGATECRSGHSNNSRTYAVCARSKSVVGSDHV